MPETLAARAADHKLGAPTAHRFAQCLAVAAAMAQGTALMMNDGAVTCVPAADPTTSAAIEVAHLVKVYKTTRAVDDLSFSIARGSITGLLGGNGARKTTTIAMIMGLVVAASGGIRVLGHSMPEESADVLGRINFESPYVDMPMRLTVRQNLTIFGRL